MGNAERIEAADGGQFVREYFDKNSAADYLSARLGKEVSPNSVASLHKRGTCRATGGKFDDGRVRWTRADLDRYIKLEMARQSLRTSYNLAYFPT